MWNLINEQSISNKIQLESEWIHISFCSRNGELYLVILTSAIMLSVISQKHKKEPSTNLSWLRDMVVNHQDVQTSAVLKPG